MPAYSNIEAFCPCTKETFEQTKGQLQQLMTLLAMPVSRQNWLTVLDWETVVDGLPQVDQRNRVRFGNGQQVVEILPNLISIIDPEGRWNTTESWIEVQILMEFNRITTPLERGYIYNTGIENVLWRLMQTVFSVFPEKGVYLTEEINDGKTLDYLTSKQRTLGNQWKFDAAIIPLTLLDEFTSVPDGFIGIENDQVHYFADKSVWRTLPWEAK